ncbi:MAG: threonine--tRNA ligase [bacterium]|nr:threonine--tRNA ligase [bacterium]
MLIDTKLIPNSSEFYNKPIVEIIKELKNSNKIDVDVNKVIVAKVYFKDGNSKLVDLTYVIDNNIDKIELKLEGDNEALEVLRHSTAHLLAQAVKRLYKDAKITIGPPIDIGFYYDIDFNQSISEKDLEKIEQEMRKIVNEKLPIIRQELSKNEAIELFTNLNESYKVELLKEDINEEVVSIYRQGEFVDLCRGPHVLNTSYLKNFKLLNLSGAYWKGDEKNKMLTRIYGTAFFSKQELEEFIKKREEAKKRDHRILGPALELFEINEDIGSGLILWLPKGEKIRYIIEQYLRELLEQNNYLFVRTPHIANSKLWEISGHLQVYHKYMFPIMKVEENQEFVLKPMNCPFHIKIFETKTRSYKDLPLRIAEYGTVYRYEKSGVLHGLLRVRGFTQDDAHIFCTVDQIEEEIINLIDLTKKVLSRFGFNDYEVYLSTRPDEFVGDISLWDQAESALKNALNKSNIDYKINEKEGAFYGPKIDIEIKDSLDRKWQCSTIQLDFNLPMKFNIHYIGSDNSRHYPVMIHRALLGSFERFFGILIEHYNGEFPFWLAPLQIVILPISDKFNEYSLKVYDIIKSKGFRVEIDLKANSLNYKIRQYEKLKIPVMIIIGQKEQETNTVNIRLKHSQEKITANLDTLFDLLKNL